MKELIFENARIKVYEDGSVVYKDEYEKAHAYLDEILSGKPLKEWHYRFIAELLFRNHESPKSISIKPLTVTCNLSVVGYKRKVVPEASYEFLEGGDILNDNVFKVLNVEKEEASKSPLGKTFYENSDISLTEEEWNGAKKVFDAFKKLTPDQAFITGLGVYKKC